MSLAPYSCRRYEQPACYARPAEMVGCQKSSILERSLKDEGKSDGIGCEQRGGCGCETGDEAEDRENQIAPPERPILPGASVYVLDEAL